MKKTLPVSPLACAVSILLYRITAMAAFLGALQSVAAHAAESPAYPFCVAYECGLVDRAGNWLVKPAYSKLEPSGPYWVGKRASGLVALLDASGKVLIPPSLKEIGQFVDGLAPAQGTRNDLYGYIDPTGKWIIEPQYFGARPFDGGVAEVRHNPEASNHLVAEFIDTHGKKTIQKKFFLSGSSALSVNGLSLVEVAGKGDATRSALIDRRGNFIVPPRDDQFIQLGNDGSIVVRQGKSERLLNAKGETLLQVRGEEASIRSIGDGIAYFEQPGKGVGLVNARTGQVIAPPRKDWVSVADFSEGLAGLRVLVGKDDVREGYINREGKVVIKPRFSNISPFRGGLAAVSENNEQKGLIDRSGNMLHRTESNESSLAISDEEIISAPHLRSVLILHGAGSADNPARYPADEAERSRRADMPMTREYLINGQRLASIHHHPCGMEVAFNAKGDRIWPENLVGRCVASQLAHGLQEEETLSPTARATYQQERNRVAREDAERNHEIQMRDKYTGGLAEMVTERLYPAKAERDKRLKLLIEGAGWLRGEAVIALDGKVRLRLPAGIKLLPPDKAALLREKVHAEMATPLPLPPGYVALQEKFRAGEVSPEEFAKQEKRWHGMFPEAFGNQDKDPEKKMQEKQLARIPMAMMADENDRWQATLHVIDRGHLEVEENSLPAPSELIETLRTYGFWRNNGGFGGEVTGYSHYEWMSPPHLEKAPRMLSWAFKYADLYSGNSLGKEGYQSGTHAHILIPGRTSVVKISTEWSGPFNESMAASYFPEIQAAARGVEFSPGQGYGDVQADDARLAFPVARLITGVPPESLENFNAGIKNYLARDEAERREKLINFLLEASILGLTGIALVSRGVKRRRNRGPAEGHPEEVRRS